MKGRPKEFVNWYHKKWKKAGDRNPTNNELDELQKDWEDLGRPRGD